MSYGLLICDFDGTLANTRQAVVNTMRETLTELTASASQPDEDEIERALARGASLPGAVAQLLEQRDLHTPARAEQIINRYRQLYSSHGLSRTILYPGVAECLASVKAAGMKCAVVSNKGEAALRAALVHLAIAGFFDLVLGEQADLPPKPAPDLYYRRVQPTFADIAPRETLFVGDTPADLQFARNCGLSACWADYGHGAPGACRALSPKFEISDFFELQVKLARIQGSDLPMFDR